MASQPTRVAVIGLGTIGQRLIGIFQKSDAFQVTGGWDLSDTARSQTAAGHPGIDVTRPPDVLIADPAIDLVYIGVPPKAHAYYTRLAIAAGKAIFCEKPLGIDLADSRALVSEVEASGLKQAVNFVYGTSRSATAIELARAAGGLGDITGVEIRMHHGLWPRAWHAAAQWLALGDQGGYTREVLSHFLYLADRLLGPGTLVAHDVRYPADPALSETHTVARLDYAGTPVTIAGSTGGSGPDEVVFTIRGSKRSYRIDNWYNLLAADAGEWVVQDLTAIDPRADTTARQVDNLADMLAGRPHTMPDFAAGLRVQGLIEAMLAADRP